MLIALVPAGKAGLRACFLLEFLAGARIIFGRIVDLPAARVDRRMFLFSVSAAASHSVP
jgi:hypothetical protein